MSNSLNLLRLINKTVNSSEVVREMEFVGDEKNFAKWERKQLRKLEKE